MLRFPNGFKFTTNFALICIGMRELKFCKGSGLFCSENAMVALLLDFKSMWVALYVFFLV